MAKANDWNKVRRELDKSDNFDAICNSPWYTDAVYEKFSDAEFARRHAAARKLMERDGLDALILTGGPDIYSHGSGVTWGSGLYRRARHVPVHGPAAEGRADADLPALRLPHRGRAQAGVGERRAQRRSTASTARPSPSG